MIELLGAVALLMFGLRLVKTGVAKSLGSRLRRWIGLGTGNRLSAMLIGVAATLLLQSSTATALLTASFATSGAMSLVSSQAIMLGANVGTSLVAALLALNLSFLSPALLAIGVFGASINRRSWHSGLFDAIVGVSLMLLSIQLLDAAARPMQHSATLVALLATLREVPLVAALLAVVLAAASASSLAIVLLIGSFSATGAVDPLVAVAMVLGANIGGAIPPCLALVRDAAAAKRVAFGNLLVRSSGVVVVLPLLDQVTSLAAMSGVPRAAIAVVVHVAFNALIAAVAIPVLRPVSRLVTFLVPEQAQAASGPQYLDEQLLTNPTLALACAARETLRIGDSIADMLDTCRDVLATGDLSRLSTVPAMDDKVDTLNRAVKFYLAKLNSSPLKDADRQRCTEIVAYATNLEHVGDIVDGNLRVLVEKKIRQQMSFSADGAQEIGGLFDITLQNMLLAQSLLVISDDHVAHDLVASKIEVRKLEQLSASNHLARLTSGLADSLLTSAVHLDMLRDLKRINAHIASIAYPILDRNGSLRESRITSDR